jgi:hypothetical protein
MSQRKDSETSAAPQDRGLEELQRQWSGLEQPEPPRMLDQAVLNTARRELERRTRRAGFRWAGAAAAAAVVVLAVAVVIPQRPQGGHAPPGTAGELDGLRLQQAEPQSLKKEQAPARVEREARDAGASREPTARAEVRTPEARTRSLAAPAPPSRYADEARQEAAATETPEAIAGKGDGTAKRSATLSADDWIDRLLALKAHGETERFRAELEAFRQAYPGHSLPPELDSE